MKVGYPRETKTQVPVKVELNGVQVFTNIEFSVVLDGSRPTTWAPAVNLSNQIGPMIDNLAPGKYRVFGRATSNPELSVFDCGTIDVT